MIDTRRAPVVQSPMPVFQLTDRIVFPPPDLAENNGLLAIGGDLSPSRLIAAYRHGIFPWFSEGDPILWWFTSPRLVLFPESLRVSKRLERSLRNSGTTCTINRDFEQVITACARRRTEENQETWITIEMINAYCELHERCYCHSVECWQNGRLVGGLYGVALGKVFFGESMFSTLSNASKFCLIHLVSFLKAHDYRLIDCQMTTAHLVRLGACEISGDFFQALLDRLITTLTPDNNWPHEKDDRYRTV
ncbi:leucyl/phenylalanyl-tRNA--protein transferase [Desulfofustis glycolicus]|uniref:Leucyl/phenylalanyl-tRNA--protein transferase n=1 Tax=Desulfofustis glycolicus DSM 9705 TaxID=1121409 RepID=A0A1M5UG38_9BACT|nr:leucyl/phenylalanyl-tRNA--protein transferase [Desulfofustis glycolicus]SHH62015.1 leucyl/phenylalanyl-tRNA--protein transferase [Desulfofustis glycolicus DSM 9705]